jgi:hypothetical protein
MGELHVTEEQRIQIARLLAAIGKDAALHERFRADPRSVLDEYGLARLVPSYMDVEIEVEASQVGAPGTAPPPSHWDSPHIDMDDAFPEPLPPAHSDWAHTDVTLPARRSTGRPVFRIGITPISPTDPR